MSSEEIKLILEEVVGNYGLAPWWGYVILIVLPFFGAYVGTFVKKKAEITATKKYTEELHKVSHQNQLLLEKYKNQNSLRMAAIDKRLQVHQEAYALWKELHSSVHTEEIGGVVMKCQSWWNENCLYLSPESREAFYTASQCAFNHSDLLNVPPNMKDKKLIDSNFKNITRAGAIIVSSVELPPLSETEKLDASTE